MEVTFFFVQGAVLSSLLASRFCHVFSKDSPLSSPTYTGGNIIDASARRGFISKLASTLLKYNNKAGCWVTFPKDTFLCY